MCMLQLTHVGNLMLYATCSYVGLTRSDFGLTAYNCLTGKLCKSYAIASQKEAVHLFEANFKTVGGVLWPHQMHRWDAK